MKHISEETSKRVCNHMNNDHIDAVNKYLRHYGEIKDFNCAHMEKITSKYMLIKYDNKYKKIYFKKEITESELHQTLVNMAKEV